MNVQLVITLDQATGAIQVSGPIEQPMLAYGLLELARDAIRDHNAQKKALNGLVIPQIVPAPLNGKGN